jgi:hypothetical protein
VAENTSGEFPDWQMISQLDDDRKSGSLQGEVTSTYFQSLITNSPRDTPAAHMRNLNTALDFLKRRESGTASTHVDVVA